MKTLLCTIAVALLLPAVASAAFNDVTLETTAIIEVGAYELTVTGSSAVIEELIVGATTFTVDLANGSSITVTSADRVDFAYDVAAQTTTETCGDASSSLTLSVASAGATTVVVTPSGTCTVAAAEEGSGGGSLGSHRKDLEDEQNEPVEPTDTTTSSAHRALLLKVIELLQQLLALLQARQGN